VQLIIANSTEASWKLTSPNKYSL